MKYKTWVFDFDYTLADATAGIVESVNYALNQLGLEASSREDIRKTVGMKLDDIFCELTDISDEQSAKLFVSNFMYMADKIMTDNTVLFDDTIDVLSQLRQSNCNTAIVSTKCHYRIDEALAKFNITNLIDYIVGLEDVADAKPSPEGLLKVIDYFGSDKQSVLFIGDSLIDAKTAANAGVDFAAVLTGTTTAQDFLKFSHIHIANNLSEFKNCIDNHHTIC